MVLAPSATRPLQPHAGGSRTVYRSGVDRRRVEGGVRLQPGNTDNLAWQPADGTRAREWLVESSHGKTPTSLSPEGKYLVFSENAVNLSLLDVPARTVRTRLHGLEQHGGGRAHHAVICWRDGLDEAVVSDAQGADF